MIPPRSGASWLRYLLLESIELSYLGRSELHLRESSCRMKWILRWESLGLQYIIHCLGTIRISVLGEVVQPSLSNGSAQDVLECLTCTWVFEKRRLLLDGLLSGVTKPGLQFLDLLADTARTLNTSDGYLVDQVLVVLAKVVQPDPLDGEEDTSKQDQHRQDRYWMRFYPCLNLIVPLPVSLPLVRMGIRKSVRHLVSQNLNEGSHEQWASSGHDLDAVGTDPITQTIPQWQVYPHRYLRTCLRGVLRR
jgi:hypothetical protein